MPAAVSAIVTGLVEDEESGAASPAVDLRQVWAEITDRRGRRHSLVVILALAQAAVVSGATSFVAIRHWIGAVPQRLAERARSNTVWSSADSVDCDHNAPNTRAVNRLAKTGDTISLYDSDWPDADDHLGSDTVEGERGTLVFNLDDALYTLDYGPA